MCNNIIILYIFMFIKLITILVLPITIFIKRKKEYIKILILVEMVLLIFFLICNVFTINKCVYNSTFKGIERTNNENMINLSNKLHQDEISYNSKNINPIKKYKTYTKKDLYYYNQNRSDIKNAYYECNGQKIYMNSIGSPITAFSIALSTIYGNNVNPVQIFNYYKEDTIDICNKQITIDNVYNFVIKRYGGIQLSEISSYEVEDAIKNNGMVIAWLSANEDSKLTCDSDYIVIYNIGLDGKFMIADPALQTNSYICPSSSKAYGNVIDKNNMNKTWSLDEIDKETVKYYLLKRGQ